MVRKAGRRQPAPKTRAQPVPWGTLPDAMVEKVLGCLTLAER